MKRIIAILLALTLSLSSAFATGGDPNIDGGGGGMGDGDKTNSWFVGNDGVRVTIIKESSRTVAAEPVDFSNIDTSNVEMHFVKKSKIQYKKSELALSSRKYQSIKLPSPLPQIISSSGGNNISALKHYFSLSGTIQELAEKTDFPYAKLISGDYVILLEPIAYFTYGGYKCAMTATEAALHDQTVSGDLKKNMGYLTHQNLPLAMFLEKPDIGYEPWTGATSGIRANSDIISSLGMGTVRFSEAACCNHAEDCACIIKGKPKDQCKCKELHPGKPCGKDTPNCDCVDKGSDDIIVPDYQYHTDTDVITSFYIYDSSGSKDGVNPDMGGKVTANINGVSYTKQYVIPPNESTLVWFKWHTPDRPKNVPISISVSGGGSVRDAVLNAEVGELKEQTPPDPQPTDKKATGWKVPTVPSNKNISQLTWGEWIPWWFKNLVWVPDLQWVEGSCDSSCPPNCGGHGGWVDNGEWVDKGWWEYDYKSYFASARLQLTTKPDDLCPTSIKKQDTWEMKSGYGVNVQAEAIFGTDGYGIDVANFQNCVVTFPEFDYRDYNRVLEHSWLKGNPYFQFYVNKYSLLGARSHYTPLWYPDNEKFEPYVTVFDAWCPGGQLILYGSDYVEILGDMYDDWNISPVNEE